MLAIQRILTLAVLAAALAGCGAGSDVQTGESAGQRQSMAGPPAAAAAPIAMPGLRSDYKVERVAGSVDLTHIATARVTRVAADARVQFSDYTLAMDVDGNAGKVYRLYRAAFKRTPDVRGLSYWIQMMDQGASLLTISNGFAGSTEFKSLYGVNPTNNEIVTRLYRNILNRDGETAGVQYWINILNRGTSVAEVLAAFSDSPENQAGMFATLSNGIAYRVDGAAYVTVANAGASRSGATGAALTLDGTESLAGAGSTLSYAWTVTERPAGSAAVLRNADTALPSFTPDRSGSYTVTLTVSDGVSSSTASATLSAFPPALSYAPLEVRYSKGLDKLVISATNPNVLKIADPLAETTLTVSLPAAVKNFSLSPNGKLAIVLHESVASLVDLEHGLLLKSFATGGSHTEALITNAAVAYFIGQTGGQWVRPSVVYFNARTGAEMTLPETVYMGMFYGTQYGVYASTKNKVFLMSQGLSPADISYFTIDPATNGVIAMGDSPYHGDYNMSTPLFLSENEDVLFSASGNYFYTSNLKYAGTFSTPVRSLSNSAAKDETLVIAGGSAGYPSSYRRFTGSLFFSDATIDFPLIDGLQSYGIKIFHSSAGKRLALVQTGSAALNGASVKYYTIAL